jgi:hypothetical protein
MGWESVFAPCRDRVAVALPEERLELLERRHVDVPRVVAEREAVDVVLVPELREPVEEAPLVDDVSGDDPHEPARDPRVVWDEVPAVPVAARRLLVDDGLRDPRHVKLVDLGVAGAHHERACRREVHRVRRVEPDHGVPEAHRVEVERLVVVELVVCQPRRRGVLDEVEVLHEHGRQVARVVPRLAHVRPECVDALYRPEAGVRLRPRALVLPLAALVELEHERRGTCRSARP